MNGLLLGATGGFEDDEATGYPQVRLPVAVLSDLTLT